MRLPTARVGIGTPPAFDADKWSESHASDDGVRGNGWLLAETDTLPDLGQEHSEDGADCPDDAGRGGLDSARSYERRGLPGDEVGCSTQRPCSSRGVASCYMLAGFLEAELHADLTMLARLSQALARARAVPLAA